MGVALRVIFLRLDWYRLLRLHHSLKCPVHRTGALVRVDLARASTPVYTRCSNALSVRLALSNATSRYSDSTKR